MMLAVGFLSSWWFVPAITDSGMDGLSVSGGVSFLWGISAPLGALPVAIGGGLYAQVGRRLPWLLVVGTVIYFALPMLWASDEPMSALFGINGGLITLFFLGLLWNWARSRPTLSKPQRLGADLGMVGHLFFLTAAWYLCGLLGAPTFTLRPELMETYGTLSSAVSLGTLISVSFVFGWGFTFAGRLVASRAKEQADERSATPLPHAAD
jgi:hypothetical protein